MKVRFIDGGNDIDKNSRDDYAPKGGHLSKKGFGKLSELLTNELNF